MRLQVKSPLPRALHSALGHSAHMCTGFGGPWAEALWGLNLNCMGRNYAKQVQAKENPHLHQGNNLSKSMTWAGAKQGPRMQRWPAPLEPGRGKVEGRRVEEAGRQKRQVHAGLCALLETLDFILHKGQNRKSSKRWASWSDQHFRQIATADVWRVDLTGTRLEAELSQETVTRTNWKLIKIQIIVFTTGMEAKGLNMVCPFQDSC